MIADLLINTVTITSRQATTVYEDGIAKKQYSNVETPVKCRISSLNYKDLQLLQWIDDVIIKVQKLYTLPDVDIKETDFVIWNGKKYKVINKYQAQDAEGYHHNKYFIKLVD